MVKEVNEKQFEELMESGKTFVCDFWAAWCGPCRMLAPVMEEASNSFPEVEFVKVNVDEYGELASKFGVMSIPFVAVFEDGALKTRSVGYLPEDEMIEFLKENL